MDDVQRAELVALKDTPGKVTKRTVNEAMESHLFEVYDALDHGFVRLVDYMGDESAICQAARVSYGAGTKAVSEDRGLLRYLVRHRHTTPLEMCEIKLHCRMPIFIARQWIRHRTANVNEYSGRYSILAKEFYVPDASVIAQQSTTNKQGRGQVLTSAQSAQVLKLITDEASRQYDVYETLLNDDGTGKPKNDGEPMLARELARMGLGLNYYTEWYWKIDVHNLLHFLSLRADPHAQYEIRVFADIIASMTQAWMPNLWQAFEDFHPNRKAHTFSAQEMELLQFLLSQRTAPLDRSLMKELADHHNLGSNRERKGFWTATGLLE